jgi:hypothetical protein
MAGVAAQAYLDTLWRLLDQCVSDRTEVARLYSRITADLQLSEVERVSLLAMLEVLRKVPESGDVE